MAAAGYFLRNENRPGGRCGGGGPPDFGVGVVLAAFSGSDLAAGVSAGVAAFMGRVAASLIALGTGAGGRTGEASDCRALSAAATFASDSSRSWVSLTS